MKTTFNAPLLADGEDVGAARSLGITDAELLARPLPQKLQRSILARLLPLLCIGYCFCFVDRSNIAFAELKMRKDPTLNLTVIDFSVGAGIFFAGYGLMQVPSLQIVQYVGARPVLGALLIIWGCFGSAIGAIASKFQLYVLRFSLGLAEAGYYPGALYYLSLWCPDELIGFASTLFTMLGATSGISLGNLTAGYILSSKALDGFHGLPIWRWLFFIQGPPAILIGFLMLLLQPDTPVTARWLTTEERRHLLAKLAGRSAPSPSTAAATAAAQNPSAAHNGFPPPSTTSPPLTSAAASPPPAPVPLLKATRRLVLRPMTWFFAAIHFGNCWCVVHIGFQSLATTMTLATDCSFACCCVLPDC